LVASTVIILFSEMLKFTEISFLQINKKNVEENIKSSKNILFVKMKITKLINCLFNRHVLKLPMYYGI